MTTASASLRVAVVTVCYRSEAVLPDMLASIPEGVEVILVENAPPSHPDLITLAKRHGARLVAASGNIGFGNACNLGAAVSQREFLLFLNPDARLTPGALEALVEGADAHPNAAAFNPRLQEADGREAFRRTSPLSPDRRKRLPKGWPDRDTQVPILSGAALLVRRAAFQQVGGFDPRIFLYHEDDDLCLRLKRDAGPLVFLRAPLVQHAAGGSTEGEAGMSPFKSFQMGRSRVYARSAHGWRLPWLRTVLEEMRRLIGKRARRNASFRSETWHKLRGAISARRDGGRYDGPVT